MGSDSENDKTKTDVTQHFFVNSPTMLALCLTTVGLVKIYAALHKITTLADNFLVACLLSFLCSTVLSYLALRTPLSDRRRLLARIADVLFLSGLSGAAFVAVFVVFTLAD